MPGLLSYGAAQLLAALGGAAVLFGSVLALRQQRLKLLIAYSTIAQIGYLFFMFPLAAGLAANEFWSTVAWTGGWLQLFSHAFAKAAMFMAAGLIADALGHDRIAELGGVARTLPITVFAFALAGLSLMGVPPSGGFVAKWLLLLATVTAGQWWWTAVILIGGLLAGGYVFMVLGRTLRSPTEPLMSCAPVPRRRELIALSVALCAVLLGLVPLRPSELLLVGRSETLTVTAR
jgi:formate hydrogenlyase subunit 3/multisubunit Na+/H+ antiporter MnhD subunit